MSSRRLQKFASERQGAFSLAEMLVVIAIVGILSSVVIGFSSSIVRRQAANSIIEDLAGWIEEVRNNAANNVRSQEEEGGCAIIFNSLTSATSQSVLAQVSPLPADSSRLCSKIPELKISQSVLGSRFSFLPSSQAATCGTLSQVCFTPRGAVNTPASENFEVKVFLLPSGPLRCLRIGATLGNVEIGASNSSSSSSDACPSSSYARF